MTYDHNTASPRGAPNAPIEWIEEQYPLHQGCNRLESSRVSLIIETGRFEFKLI